MGRREDIRNIAIIAHVDHGKTTLVDQMLKQSGIFRDNEQVDERVMDSNDIEKERGITILAKNTSVFYNNIKINIIDTPGHADFGGEVERILMMVDGVILLVDAFEGCMPQTKFVLKKALGLGKHPIVVVNKIDKADARPDEVIDEVLDLFIELEADEDQLDFTVVYASGRDGKASMDAKKMEDNLEPLFKTIVENIPAPQGELDMPYQILISNIASDDYLGRIGIGRVERGTVKNGETCVVCTTDGKRVNARISKLFQFEGLKRVETDCASLGDIIAVAGIDGLNIGETLCSVDLVEPLEFVNIDEPTVSMNFIVNDSPFAGKEGKFVTSRHLRERLFKEVETNVSMRVFETEQADTFTVYGRGELHLSILIENMRREGFEFQVSRPHVIFKTIDGVKNEPMELLTIDVPQEFMGAVMEKMGERKGELVNMTNNGLGTVRLELNIPARGLMGYRSEFLTDTKGTGIMNHIFNGYAPYKGEIMDRARGSLVAFESGETSSYGLFNAQERGRLFMGAGMSVYEGQIVGENARNEDMAVNVCKKKHLTNMRASGSDDTLKLIPPTVFSLEQSIEFIAEDELIEVTPKSIRLRKMVLSKELRMKAASRK